MTIDREELRRLCEAATPGPWTLDPCDGAFGFVRSGIVWTAKNDSAAFSGSDFIQAKTEDAAFIAAARTAVPALLDALEAAEAREKRLREALNHYMEQHCEAYSDCGAADITDGDCHGCVAKRALAAAERAGFEFRKK